ncbi:MULTISPECIES: acetate kinase [unclassified Campylobacter]|uniref:acetate kinase n=1 Tax=unclassified Campylobacter TaxID=2593542 RepID=UPI001237EBE6|nr:MULTISPECIES: acetate kinase [unclassified Campylobacter]KAA6226388.1 acetate kinase [Campylobacter sp. LR286c]KAA6226574.1 acetate kinase [Campylobacter sp. LR185c]KAA6226879.1 acetate kinase [Campylobacter sp. LR196d]KAA6230317.1 acetate kinase [Campylobacter sp. LR291e]KAA8603620.1 acetate kinase [Campylobacter sp. LR185c]
MKILVLNSGSSSIKFKLFVNQEVVASGLVEKIGNEQGKIELKNVKTQTKLRRDTYISNHEKGLKLVKELCAESGILKDFNELDGCGHRVVHGGRNLTEHCLVDGFVLEEIDRVGAIAPLHNPAHLAGIKTMIKAAPNVPNVTIFDTAFHKTIPDYAHMYALPYEYYTEYNIRKYGFHGTSHSYVSKRAAALCGKNPDEFNAISAHLGNGASICAIENGKSVDTSMGFTPLEGLMMGTRCGDIDPAILPFIANAKNLSPNELDTMMNKKSGLYGVCGYNDIRDVEKEIQSGNSLANLALNMYCYRMSKYIGSYFSILPRTDALIFTAGVGENAVNVRKMVCNRIKHLGIEIDDSLNENSTNEEREISSKNSKVKIFIIPTDEELEIAKITERIIKA